MTALTVEINAEQVLVLAERMEGVTGARLNAALVKAVNQVGQRYDSSIRRAMNKGIALSDEYVSSRMSVEPATNAPVLTITTIGPGGQSRKGLTILGHYNPQKTADGVQIEVTRGAPKQLLRRAFIMRLKSGTVAGDRFGVFERIGPGKTAWKHLYGVSPYSLFRYQATQQSPAIEADLQEAALVNIAEAIDL